MSNPLIDDLREQDLIQTVSIALPTGGRYYEPGVVLEPGTDPDDVEIRAIGVMAEIYAKDPFLVAAGKGLSRIVKQVCPAVLDPDRLCEVDVEAILIAARLVSHGPEFSLKHKCENPKLDGEGNKICEFESEVNLDLQKTIMQYEPLPFDERFVVDIPEANQVVYLKPLEYRDAMNVVKRSFLIDQKFKGIAKTGMEKFFTDEEVSEEYAKAIDAGVDIAMESLADAIFCVESSKGDKVADREFILKWLDRLSDVIGKRIQTAIQELGNLLKDKSTAKYKCPECEFENKFQLVLDPERLFFSKVENSKVQKTPSTSSKRTRRTGTRPPKTSRKSHTPSKE